jgi:hypothetical protein
MTGATHFIEQWKDRKGETHFTKVKPIKEFNKALTKSRYGFKTLAVFQIKFKEGFQP